MSNNKCKVNVQILMYFNFVDKYHQKLAPVVQNSDDFCL